VELGGSIGERATSPTSVEVGFDGVVVEPRVLAVESRGESVSNPGAVHDR
jgi:hypothetical protein